MKIIKIIKIQFIVIALFFAGLVLAQEVKGETEVNTVQFGQYLVEYDASEEVSQYHTAYIKDKQIVLSVFDTDENGSNDLWLRYNQDLVLNLEASDSNNDGEPDTFVSLDSEENVTDVSAPEFQVEEVILPQNPNPKQTVRPVETSQADYFVLGAPPTENKFHFPLKWILIILMIGVVGFLVLKRKKK
jgi:hypothetical protein